jgi:hypothetical protein
MAPFTTAQCRGWTLLGCVVGRYPWSRGNVDTKGAPVTLLTLLGHPPDVGLNSPAALARIGLDPMILSGLGHTDHLLPVRDLRSRWPTRFRRTGPAPSPVCASRGRGQRCCGRAPSRVLRLSAQRRTCFAGNGESRHSGRRCSESRRFGRIRPTPYRCGLSWPCQQALDRDLRGGSSTYHLVGRTPRPYNKKRRTARLRLRGFSVLAGVGAPTEAKDRGVGGIRTRVTIFAGEYLATRSPPLARFAPG